MAIVTKQYTFAPGTRIQSSEVNANFDRLFTFLNDSVIHRDASKAFTGVPLLPAIDPTNASHAARKAYVDARAAAAQTYARGLIKGGSGGGTTNGVGDMLIAHGLGVTPTGVSLTPNTMLGGDGNPNTSHRWYPTIQNMDETNLNIRIFDSNTGIFIAGGAFVVNYIVVA